MVAAIGFVAAPVLFATLPRSDAGRVAAHLFEVDAALGLGMGALVLVLALQEARRRADSGASRFSTEMMLALGALFCIVAGHYAIEPMLASAGRDGVPSFAVLHGVATAFFVVKFAAVAGLAWRFGATAAPEAGGAATTAATSS